MWIFDRWGTRCRLMRRGDRYKSFFYSLPSITPELFISHLHEVNTKRAWIFSTIASVPSARPIIRNNEQSSQTLLLLTVKFASSLGPDGRVLAKWMVMASVLLMFHLQGWPCDCWCLPQIKAMSPLGPKDTRIIALLAYLPRWCMASIASQSPTVFITNYGGRNQLITTETAGSLVRPHARGFSCDVSVLLI